MNRTELDALIYLLDDPDESVYESVSEKLISMGDGIITELEESWENDFNPLQQERIENIIHLIQFNNIQTSFEDWVSKPEPDIKTILFLLNQFQFPAMDESDIASRILSVSKPIWLELNQDLTPIEQINVFNHVFYKIQKFKHLKYEDAKLNNYFISHFLNSKHGTNVLLGLFYQVLAQELNIPVYGICLPDQFILARTNTFINEYNESGYADAHVLFYINPNQGAIFTKREIIKYLQKLNLKRDKRYYLPSSPYRVVKHYLKELLEQYKSLGKDSRVDELWQLIDFVNESSK